MTFRSASWSGTALLVLAFSTSAQARDLEGKVTILATPGFGQDDAFDLDADIVDEGEYSAEIEANLPKIWRDQGLALLVGVTASPQIFDKQQATTSQYAELKFGDSWQNITKLTAAESKSLANGNVQDRLRPFLKLRYTENFTDTFDQRSRTGQDMTIGLRYSDVRTIMCDVAGSFARKSGACSDVPGVSYELRGELLRSWSSDDNREVTQITGRFDLSSRPIAGAFRLSARARVDRSLFSHALALAGEKRREWRYRLGIGANLTPLVSKLNEDLSFDTEFRRQWRDSNDPARDKNDFHILATLTWSMKIQ